MKKIISALMLSALFSASSFAATQITHEQTGDYTKIGNLAISQNGVPNVGTTEISNQADQKCQELDSVAPANCFYVVVAVAGNESDYKDINLELFKK